MTVSMVLLRCTLQSRLLFPITTVGPTRPEFNRRTENTDAMSVGDMKSSKKRSVKTSKLGVCQTDAQEPSHCQSTGAVVNCQKSAVAEMHRRNDTVPSVASCKSSLTANNGKPVFATNYAKSRSIPTAVVSAQNVRLIKSQRSPTSLQPTSKTATVYPFVDACIVGKFANNSSRTTEGAVSFCPANTIKFSEIPTVEDQTLSLNLGEKTHNVGLHVTPRHAVKAVAVSMQNGNSVATYVDAASSGYFGSSGATMLTSTSDTQTRMSALKKTPTSVKLGTLPTQLSRCSSSADRNTVEQQIKSNMSESPENKNTGSYNNKQADDWITNCNKQTSSADDVVCPSTTTLSVDRDKAMKQHSSNYEELLPGSIESGQGRNCSKPSASFMHNEETNKYQKTIEEPAAVQSMRPLAHIAQYTLVTKSTISKLALRRPVVDLSKSRKSDMRHDFAANTGYMSDGDVMHKHRSLRQHLVAATDESNSGYISEGGVSQYVKRMQQRFNEGMRAAHESIKATDDVHNYDRLVGVCYCVRCIGCCQWLRARHGPPQLEILATPLVIVT
jgi:hypothetical protein